MLKYLKPQKIKSEKIRLGSKSDGGYVIPKLLAEKCSVLVTYGYGGDKTFEDDFISKFEKPNFIFDHTGHPEKWSQGEQYFYPEGLGSDGDNSEEKKRLFDELYVRKKLIDEAFQELEEDHNVLKVKKYKKYLEIISETVRNLYNILSLKTVKEHYDEFKIEGDIFLKIDAEGAEYDYFLNADIKELESFVAGIVLEFHWLEQPQNQEKFEKIMEKLNEHFVLVHTHGNNWGGEFVHEGHKVPKVLELTFVNKKHLDTWEPDTTEYPIKGLDFPNNSNLPECDLSFLKSV